jgi:hypothetical protein
METSRTRTVVWVLFCWLVVIGGAHADWLVTQEGKQVQTKGPWEVRRNLVVFTLPNGTLSSMRLSEVDLEKSESLTAEAVRPPEAVEAETPKEPVLVLTTRDVGRGEEGSTGPEALVERLRNAHKYQDLGLMMGLVNWQDTPDSIRAIMEIQFEWMLERRLKDVVLNEVAPDESLEQIQNGVTFEPNVDVTHKIEVQFVPDPDTDELTLSFYVGTRLGTYQIAAARPLEEGF